METQSRDVDPEEMEDTDDDAADASEESYEENMQIQKDYMAPEAEEKLNQFAIIKHAIKDKDTTRTTYLTPEELGRPMFSVRFYQDYCDFAGHYLNGTLDEMGFDPQTSNFIAHYFKNKVLNITNSGMSNKGFTMNLSVTQKRDTTKKRIKEAYKDGTKVKS